MYGKSVSSDRVRGGFTLVEVMLIVGIISLLFGVVLIALNPSKRLADANDDKRRSDVAALLGALGRYKAFNRGNLPAGFDSVPGSSQVVGTDASGCGSSCAATTTLGACLDLGATLVESYLAEIPVDPKIGTSGNTGYFVNRTPDGKTVVGACGPESAATIAEMR